MRDGNSILAPSPGGVALWKHSTRSVPQSKKERNKMKAVRTLAIALLTLLAWSAVASSQEAFTAGTWTKLTNATPNGAGINQILLLQDGTVMAQDAKFATPNNWYKLTPDKT